MQRYTKKRKNYNTTLLSFVVFIKKLFGKRLSVHADFMALVSAIEETGLAST